MDQARGRVLLRALIAAVIGTALVGAAVITAPQLAEAESAGKSGHDTPGADLISFSLRDSPGHVITPNALNYAQTGTVGEPLLLFLPATRSIPADYRNFLGTASSLGYSVLALDYWNRGRSVVKTCQGDPDCYTAVQQNRFDGTSPSVFSAIHPNDSIVNRVRLALAHLRESDPSGDWKRYTTGSHIHWSRIVLAGHSQGGGQSAYISHIHRVHGVLMFSSPVESDQGVPASWMTTPGKTPASAMYGFDDDGDVYHSNIVGSWSALGMGEPVDAAELAFHPDAHSIVSDVALGTPGEAHLKSVTDRGPVDSAGVPVFQPVWRWMLQQVLKPESS